MRCGVLALALAPLALLYTLSPARPASERRDNTTAIYSLITSNDRTYVDELRLLSRSMLAFAPEYPLHVLVTSDVSPAIVSEIGAFAVVRVVPAYPEPSRPMMYERWIHQFTKFKFWSFREHGQICYMDADVAFFGGGTLQAIVAECSRSFEQKKIKLCGFESDCRNGGGDRKSWGMRYMQANAFCLRPDAALFEDIEENLIQPFLRGNFVFYGRGVSTEQDVMNLYFKHRLHYLDCEPIRSGRFLHGKSENGWIEWEIATGVY
jgi:hypothetical protein